LPIADCRFDFDAIRLPIVGWQVVLSANEQSEICILKFSIGNRQLEIGNGPDS